ncbi:glycosyltransferase family 4 protein [Niabella insulamsoli]|uniref:glycosyltransferase family 4 protein n=1 Tax=Niabella insulamsoli TaxID=3144874 RepID=UPI0031FDF84B
MLQIFVSAIISFIVAFLAIPVIIQIADKKKLYDIPDERKLHKNTIASLGGIGVFIGLTFSSLITINFQQNPEFQYFFAAIFCMFFIGLKDDIIALSAFKKFIVQIVAAGIVIHLGGLEIKSLYGIFGIHEIESVYGVPLTYLSIILVVNAYNLIDGVDGLAGGLGLMIMMLLGAYFTLSGMTAYAILSLSLAAGLMAFMIFNFHPAKIFMGDSGSLLIGLLASILVLKFINVAGDPNSAFHIHSAAAVGVSLLLIPLVDTIRVFSIRILKGRSPFSPDRNHIHHILLDKGLNHASVTLVCVCANVAIIGGVYFARNLGNTALLLIVFGLSISFIGVLYATIPRRRRIIQRQIFSVLQDRRATSKVIDLTTKKHLPAEKIQG